MKNTNRNKSRIRIIYVIIKIFICLLLYVMANAIIICEYSKHNETRKAEAAIILGAAVWGEEPSPVFRERINHGIWLYQQGYVEKLLMTGGYSEGNTLSDAEVAKNYAITKGIPTEDILIETQSVITAENLYYAKIIMEEYHIKQVLIVSDPLHMKRSMLMAEDLDIEAFSSPTPTTRYTGLKAKSKFLARELFFYIGYKWKRILKVC